MSREAAKTTLFVVGIIETVLGGIAAIGSLIGLIGSFALMGTGDALGAGLGIIALVAMLAGLISSAWSLVVGIMGIAVKKDEEKAKTCYIFGIILLALQAVSLITALVNSSFGFGNILGLVIPVLYTYAAYVVKKELF